MRARVTKLHVLPGKWKAAVRSVESMLPKLRKQEGFRTLLVMRAAKDPTTALIVSVWDSQADLKESEKSLFVYQALSRLMSHCKGFPDINEYEVLLTEYAAD